MVTLKTWREQMSEDMRLRDFRPRTQEGYLLAVLHTWTRTLEWHPHVHLLVPGGGLAPDGRTWRAALSRRTRYLVPVRALSKLFRARFLHLARRALPRVAVPQIPWSWRPSPWCTPLRGLHRNPGARDRSGGAMTSPLALHGKGAPRVPRHTCAQDPKAITIAAPRFHRHCPSAVMNPLPSLARSFTRPLAPRPSCLRRREIPKYLQVPAAAFPAGLSNQRFSAGRRAARFASDPPPPRKRYFVGQPHHGFTVSGAGRTRLSWQTPR
jgi:Putative transposase